MMAEGNLATVAIVGENMKHTPGIAGKLFGTLGRNGINVIACAQGASETNISFVVEAESLRKTLNVIHDSFFLSEYQVLNLFICGIGTVGHSLIEQIHSQQEKPLLLPTTHGTEIHLMLIRAGTTVSSISTRAHLTHFMSLQNTTPTQARIHTDLFSRSQRSLDRSSMNLPQLSQAATLPR